MVARSEHGVLHAGGFGNRSPGIGVELVGMKLTRQLGVLVNRNLLVPLHPFAAAGNGIDAPMHEQAELGVSPPGNARRRVIVGNHRLLGPGDGSRGQDH